jgi:hypothetical protein
MKTMIYIGVTVGGIAGGWIGSLIDHGNIFGAWGILLGGVGSIIGIWAGYKIGQNL